MWSSEFPKLVKRRVKQSRGERRMVLCSIMLPILFVAYSDLIAQFINKIIICFSMRSVM